MYQLPSGQSTNSWYETGKERIAFFVEARQVKHNLDVLRSGKLHLNDCLPRRIRGHLSKVSFFKITIEAGTFKFQQSWESFALSTLQQIFDAASHLQQVVLDGIPDTAAFVDRFCRLLQSFERGQSLRSFRVRVIHPEWSASSLRRVDEATQHLGSQDGKNAAMRAAVAQMRMGKGLASLY